MENSDQIQRMVAFRLGAFKDVVLAALNQKIQSLGLVASGELLNSLQGQLAARFSPFIDSFALQFADSGRFAELKQLNYGKMPPIPVIEKWILSRGLENFSRIPGYRNASPIDRQRAARRLAFAISFNRKYHNQKKAVKLWSKDFYSRLNQLTTEIVADAMGITGKVMITSFEIR